MIGREGKLQRETDCREQKCWRFESRKKQRKNDQHFRSNNPEVKGRIGEFLKKLTRKNVRWKIHERGKIREILQSGKRREAIQLIQSTTFIIIGKE